MPLKQAPVEFSLSRTVKEVMQKHSNKILYIDKSKQIVIPKQLQVSYHNTYTSLL